MGSLSSMKRLWDCPQGHVQSCVSWVFSKSSQIDNEGEQAWYETLITARFKIVFAISMGLEAFNT